MASKRVCTREIEKKTSIADDGKCYCNILFFVFFLLIVDEHYSSSTRDDYWPCRRYNDISTTRGPPGVVAAVAAAVAPSRGHRSLPLSLLSGTLFLPPPPDSPPTHPCAPSHQSLLTIIIINLLFAYCNRIGASLSMNSWWFCRKSTNSRPIILLVNARTHRIADRGSYKQTS